MPVGTIWTPEEDERLAQLVKVHGPKKWSQIASELGTKGSKQCRRRWKNFINLEERKQGSWTPEEDAQLLEGHTRHGNKWTLIAQEIGGRTDNAVKNRWAALEKKRRSEEDAGERPAHRGNDLLAVRRIISKDQPHHRASQLSAAAAAAIAAEPAWLGGLRQQGDQTPYSPSLAAQHAANTINNMPVRKPDLMINIPGSTAIEYPYSQPSQGNIEFRVNKGALSPVEMQLAQELNSMDLPVQIHVEDESLLSTSRQAAHNAIAALTSPTEGPEAINSLYTYLCSATPQGTQQQQQQVASGRRSPPPWAGRGGEMMPQQQPQLQQLHPPAVLQPQQQLVPVAAQLQQQQQLYQQLPVTGQQLQMQPPQLQMLQGQPGCSLQHPMQQQMLMQQPPASMQHQQLPPPQQLQLQQMYAPVMIHDGHKQLVAKVARMCAGQGQEYSQQPATSADSYALAPTGAMHGSFQGPGPAAVVDPAGMLQSGGQAGMRPHVIMEQQQSQQQYHPEAWQGFGAAAPAAPAGHFSSAMNAGSSSAPAAYRQLQPQQLPMAPLQQQPVRYEEQKQQWGPEELRQLLDLLGDQQQQQHQQPEGCVGPEQPQHCPEEEVEQVNNGQGAVHALPAGPDGAYQVMGPCGNVNSAAVGVAGSGPSACS